ncbi:PIN domain-containing protein [Xylella fastidiosa]|uniref:PIN domain-containing protein n=1 Tax=Xylella fastidiosa TaxID=2371 RepID=A0ABD7BXV6_XYLFS|nr:PIN domain-containing protein [Xylella fastidiosa]QPB72688.1 PIN domain-containing protein [Xylella fastidiosa]
MILLDTNVVSEPLRYTPDVRIIAWIDAQPLETLYLSAMTVAELRSGVALLPIGKRREALHEDLEKNVLPMFVGRVLPFDFACTNAYAELLAKVRKAGRSIQTADACSKVAAGDTTVGSTP